MIRLQNRCAVITGGAMGIGLATAKRLLDQGCVVTLWDMNAAAWRMFSLRSGRKH